MRHRDLTKIAQTFCRRISVSLVDFAILTSMFLVFACSSISTVHSQTSFLSLNGYIYSDNTGKLITGGSVSLSGPGQVYVVFDGSSGYYELYTDGTPGIYTLSYSHPNAYPLSQKCPPQPGPPNLSGLSPPLILGSDTLNYALIDTACSSNYYFLLFNPQPGDPTIYNHNLPLQTSAVGSRICFDNNYNDVGEPADPGFQGMIVQLFNCSDTINPIKTDTTDIQGRFKFEDLISGDYRVKFIIPSGHRPLQGSLVNENGMTDCFYLTWGVQDSSKTICVFPCPQVDAGADENICLGTPTQLQASVPYGSGSYSWTPTAGLSATNVANPTASPLLTTVYTVNYNDGLGCSSVDSLTVFVRSSSPYISVPAPAQLEGNCSGIIPFVAPVFADSCDLNLTVTLDSLVFPQSCGYRIERLWVATNAQGNSTPFLQVVNVSDNVAPVFQNPPPPVLSFNCKAQVTAPPTMTATDNCAGNLVYDFKQDSTGTSCSYILDRTWTATDGCGNKVTYRQLVSVVDNVKPTLNGVPGDMIVECQNIPPPAQVTAYDNCGTPTLIFNETSAPGVAICEVIYTRTWTATDACGNSTIATQKITVRDTKGPVITMTHPLLLNLKEGDTLRLSCKGVSSIKPNDVSVVDACCRDVTWSQQVYITASNCTVSGYIQLMKYVWNASDCCGNRSSFSFYVLLYDNTPPVLQGVPDDIYASCTNPVMPKPNVKAVDDCDNDVSVTLKSDTTVLNCGIRVVNVWTAVDKCGNTARDTQIIQVNDDISPVIANVPSDTIVSCSAMVPLRPANVIATDNCDPAPLLNFSETVSGSGCFYTIRRTWTAIDRCGNRSIKSQNIIVHDKTGPVIIGLPKDTTVNCNAIPAVPAVTAMDACIGPRTVTFSETVSGNKCSKIITRTWTASDNCGNTSVGRQIIQVVDTIRPVLHGVPGDQVLECGTVPPPPPVVTATDICTSVVTVGYAETQSGTGCAKVITRTWSSVDSCGNIAVAQQRIRFIDSVKPVLSGVPSNITLECGSSVPQAKVTAFDVCDGTLAVQFNQSTTGSGCIKTLTRTWSAADGCGNTITGTQVITFVDTQKPELFGVSADISVECGSQPQTAFVTAFDECDGPLNVNYSETRSGSGCSRIILRTWRAVDACGHEVSATQRITMTDTRKPVLSGVPASLTVECGNTIPNATVTASDNCDASVSVVMSESTAALGCNIVLTRTWTATDSCGNSASASQTININDTQKPILSGVPSDSSVECGTNVPVAIVTAIDKCFGPLAVSFSETFSGIGCNRLITRTWTAKDACGNASSAVQRIIFTDTQKPVLIGVPSNVSLPCGSAVPAVSVTATDICNGQLPVIYSEIKSGRGCNQTITRTWSTTDSCGNTTSGTQVVSFTDTVKPMLVGVPANITLECGAVIPAANVTATDNCDSIVAVVMTSSATGTGCNRTVTRTWTATDICGNSSSASQLITFIDTQKPVLSGIPAELTLECRAPLPSATVTATDVCSGSLPVVMTSDTAGNSCTRIITRTWTATDSCGNSVSASQKITLNDTKAPVFTEARPDITVACSNIPTATNPAAVDACGSSVIVTLQETNTKGECGFKIQRTWSARDNCGNSTTLTQIITVEDKTGPTFANVPKDTTVSCGMIPPVSNPLALDDCLSPTTMQFAELTLVPNPCTTLVLRTWMAKDACGNESLATQTITVRDVVAPTISLIHPRLSGKVNGDTVHLDCNSVLRFSASNATATDNCGQATVSYSEAMSVPENCSDKGYFTRVSRIWTASDACGNTRSLTLNFLYHDNIPPVLIKSPKDTSIECGQPIPPFGSPVFDDACGLENIAVLNDSTDTHYGYDLTRTWIATDACRNLTSTSQTIKVYRKGRPVFVGVPKDTLINSLLGERVPPVANVTAVESCSGQSIPVTFKDTTIVLHGACDTLLIRTWSGTTQGGISGSASQQILILGGVDVETVMQPDSCTSGKGSVKLSPVNYSYVWSDGYVGPIRNGLLAGGYHVTVSKGLCADSILVFVDNYCDNCIPLFKQDSISAQITKGQDSTVCIPVPYFVSTGYNIFIDGQPYQSGIGACDENTVVFYSYALVLGQGKTGPYEIEWSVNDTIFTTTVNNMDELVSKMNTADKKGSWVHNPLFLGFSSPNIGGKYGDLRIKHTATQISSLIKTNFSKTPMGTALVIPEGTHKVVYVNREDNCRDSLIVNVQLCSSIFSIDTLTATIVPGLDSTVCIPVPYSHSSGYEVWVNGIKYSAPVGPCDNNTVVFYSYALAVGQGSSGPYLATWENNGDTLRVTVNNMDELVAAMNVADTSGKWQHNPLFLGFTSLNIGGDYGDMTIKHLGTQITAFIQTNYSSTPMGTSLIMEEGVSEVVYVDKVTGCRSRLVVKVNSTPPLSDDIVPEKFSVIKGICDRGYLTYCLPIKLTEKANYELQLNGKIYNSPFDTCDFTSDHFYSYVTLPGLGKAGPYQVDWKVNKVAYKGTFNSISELVARMNEWDVSGNWRNDAVKLSIRGGHPTIEYSSITVKQVFTGAIAVMEISRSYIPNNMEIQLPGGRNTLVVKRLVDGLLDTLVAHVACLTPDYVDTEVPVNVGDTICLSTTELVGEVISVTNICDEDSLGPVKYFILPGSVCIINYGKYEGEARGCFVICDAFGVCDTTYINTTVKNRVSVLVIDSLKTRLNIPITGLILANDTIRGKMLSVRLHKAPRNGIAFINPDYSVTYTPDREYCNTMPGGEPDKFTYEVCTQYACYTMDVIVIVECEPFQVYTGFSPNGDGINDFFRIEGLQRYPNHYLEVYNRWGNRIFRTKNYRNDWGGNWQQNDLPDGTYFYILDDGEGKTYSGYIQIRR